MTGSQYKYHSGRSMKKLDALQDQKICFLYTNRNVRSTAFQPRLTLGGVHMVEMSQSNDFLRKSDHFHFHPLAVFIIGLF